MKWTTLLVPTWCLAACLAHATPQEDPAPQTANADEVELQVAGPAQLELLLKRHATAVDDGDGPALMRVLNDMSSFENPELASLARDALRYRASKADERAAKAEGEQLAMSSPKEVRALVLERESGVQVAAARLLENFAADKKTAPALLKTFKAKGLKKDKPKAFAAVIHALGTCGVTKIEKDVFKELKLYGHEDVMRSCVRYFGLIKTRNYKVVRSLCAELSAPEPSNVNSAGNPPSSYWEARWKSWSAMRRELTWTLEQITGQVFRPDEGDVEGDAEKALEYIKTHKRELGLK